MNYREITIRPSKAVIAILSPAVLISAYFGVFLVIKGFDEGTGFVALFFGFFCLVVTVVLVCAATEGLSIKIHEAGVEKTKIFRKGKFISKTMLRWEEIQEISQGQYFQFRLIGASSRVDLNLAYFTNMGETKKFINEHLPSGCQKLPN